MSECRDGAYVRLSVCSVALRGGSGSVQAALPRRRASDECRALGEGRSRASDCEPPGEGGDVWFNIGANLSDLVRLGIDKVEEVGCLNRVHAGARKREVVCRRDCAESRF